MEIRRAVARPARPSFRVATSRRVAMARAGLQCPKGRRRESPELEVWWGEKSWWISLKFLENFIFFVVVVVVRKVVNLIVTIIFPTISCIYSFFKSN